ncbi:MAG: hypothetical protein Kow0068_05830 [Marinilabiliales bacterium]
MKKIILLPLAICLSFSFVIAQNIIQNGDFESWTGNVPNNWTTIDPSIHLAPETSIVHGGTTAMNVWVVTTTQSETDLRQSVDVTNGNVYDISFWVYQVDSLSRVTLYVDNWTGLYSDPANINTWQQVTYQYIATATATIEIGLRFYDVTGFVDSSNVIIDDFTMIDVTGTGTNPYVTNVSISPVSPTSSDPVDVYADITDDGTIVSAYAYWSTNGTFFNDSISMSVLSGDTYVTDAPIPAQPNGTLVYYYVKAIDDNAEEGVSPNYVYVIPYGVPFGDCQNLFFSECIEGSSYNKVLEIYNPTPSDIDMSNYLIQKFNNGSTTVSATFNLTGIIPAGGTYVLANPGSDSINVLTKADTITNFISHNGNDAYVLFNYVDTIDVFGMLGSSANFDIDGVSGAAVDNTLIRKSFVQAGQIDWSIGNTEWDIMGIDVFTDIGQHTMTPCQVNVETIPDAVNINIFPNPANDVLMIENLDNIVNFSIINVTGMLINKINTSSNKYSLDVKQYANGIYYIVFKKADNSIMSKKITIVH